MGDMGRCDGCRAPIKWIKMVSGKYMPCNPERVRYWPQEGAKDKVVTSDGRVVSCRFVDYGPYNLGYTPHFATCPKAGQFKK